MEISKKITDKLSEGRQYRDIDISMIECRALEDDDSTKIVEGYAATFNEPYLLFSWDGYRVYEQIDPEAFNECDMSDVIMQYNHEGRVFARTGNGTLSVVPDDRGLKIRAELSGTDLGRDVYEEIKGGYTTKMSFGFRVEEDKREVTENHESNEITVMRTITKISKLYDVSAVSLPANDATSISARSYGEGVISEIMEECQKREQLKKKIRILTEVTK